MQSQVILCGFLAALHGCASIGPGDLDTLTLRSKVYTAAPVALTRGEFRAPAAPGSTSEVMVKLSDKRAFGTLDGKQAGALIVTTSVGGTGTFYELALLGRSEQGWVNTDSVLLGDRINLRSVAIENDQIVVAMTTHGPRDRCAAPRWKRRGGGRFETIDSWRSPTRHPGSARSRERPDSGCTRSTTTASAPRLPSPRTIRCAFRTAARSTSRPTATGRGHLRRGGKTPVDRD